MPFLRANRGRSPTVRRRGKWWLGTGCPAKLVAVTGSDLILAGLFFVAAALYSSVGHAGASGYLAAMAFMAVAPPIMKPTALVLNILVASLASISYLRAGYMSWPLAWPFILGAVPLAFVGGALRLEGFAYKALMAIVLFVSALRLAITTNSASNELPAAKRPPLHLAVAGGAGIGLLAGLTGTGGGIFLSPLLLFTGWASLRMSFGICAVFILANSLAGLAGNFSSVRHLPDALWLWALAAGLGGIVGSQLGNRILPQGALRRLLALVLVVAGAKLLFS